MINQVIAQEIINPVIVNGHTQVGSPQAYFNSVVQTVFAIFFIVGVIYFIWHFVFAGYHYIASDGDPKKIETAKSEITYACVGILVVFCVYGVLKFVGTVLGIPSLNSLTIPWPGLLNSP